MKPELRRQLLWLMVLRVVMLTTLVFSVVFLQAVLGQPGAADVLQAPFLILLGLGYGFTAVSFVLYRVTRWSVGLAYAQFVGDVLLVSGIVFFTGGLFSPFSFLYLLVILVASILLYRQGGLLISSLSFVVYSSIVLLMYYGFLPSRIYQERLEESARPLQTVVYYLALHMFGFFTIAWLSSYLSEKLRGARADLEKRKRELAELQALNENIVGSLTSGLLTTDGEFRVTYANSVVGMLLGGEAGALRGRAVDGILRWGAERREEVRRALEGAPSVRLEQRLPAAEGKVLHLGVSASRLAAGEGREPGYLLLIDDLTELKALEEEVRVKDRMAALGEMAAGLAHEIRNPLSSMTGSVQVLRRDLELTGDQDRLMGIVIEESRRLDGVIGEFLEFARPGGLRTQRINLRTLVEETLNLARHAAETGGGVEIRLEGPAEVSAVVDGGKIRQVVWNLVKNALKAMPGGGTLTVRVEAGGGTARLVFRDTGVGMTEEEKQVFLEPFRGAFRGGVGLGLTIVYRIVEDHGGWLSIRSEKGKGTEIAVHLPILGRRESPADLREREEVAGGRA